jgi:hypothetical protein
LYNKILYGLFDDFDVVQPEVFFSECFMSFYGLIGWLILIAVGL